MSDLNTCTAKAEIELADVVRQFWLQYTSQFRLMPSQARALWDIMVCCTEVLGGRLYQCDDCEDPFWIYFGCRNRACPKCHGSQTREWLEKREAELLPCDYFHAVATVPSELRDVFRLNQRMMYGLLMQVTAEAVKELCANKRHLGALPGILSVLHTWTGQLHYHPHVHMLITGGGITPDGQHWQPTRREFLVPVVALSRKIAAKFRDALQAEAPDLFDRIPASVWRREWVSFIKHYGHGNDAVLNYLSRYVFRTAISNARILALDETHVTFCWTDRDAHVCRTERLPGVEFLRRFLQHVLPPRFHKVRYYGLWHSSKRSLSNQAWLLLILETPADSTQPPKLADLVEALGQLSELTGQALDDEPSNLPCCPHCGSSRTRLILEHRPLRLLRPRFPLPLKPP